MNKELVKYLIGKITIEKNGCWTWNLKLSNKGYGRAWFNKKFYPAHVLVFQLLKSEVPKDRCLDHLCRNRKCVNPDHLEIVTVGENVLRGIGHSARNSKKTHCLRGHLLSGSNLIIRQRKNNKIERKCRACEIDYQKRYYLSVIKKTK